METEVLDAVDQRILSLLERDCRKSNQAIGKVVGLTASSVFERVKKLEKQNVITGFVALVDPAAVGRPITAFIRLMVSSPKVREGEATGASVPDVCRDDPEILECHHVAGEDCYILKVRTSSPRGLERLGERIRRGVDVQRSVTAIVLSTAKETTSIVPLSEETP
jgi:Lrp/AsnC family leucine-responsive transcriptional regulator